MRILIGMGNAIGMMIPGESFRFKTVTEIKGLIFDLF